MVVARADVREHRLRRALPHDSIAFERVDARHPSAVFVIDEVHDRRVARDHARDVVEDLRVPRPVVLPHAEPSRLNDGERRRNVEPA